VRSSEVSEVCVRVYEYVRLLQSLTYLCRLASGLEVESLSLPSVRRVPRAPPPAKPAGRRAAAAPAALAPAARGRGVVSTVVYHVPCPCPCTTCERRALRHAGPSVDTELVSGARAPCQLRRAHARPARVRAARARLRQQRRLEVDESRKPDAQTGRGAPLAMLSGLQNLAFAGQGRRAGALESDSVALALGGGFPVSFPV